jgi:hypothetical protein
MKSLKHYIKLVEAMENPPDGWIATVNVYYAFPNNDSIPQRTKNIEQVINQTMESHGFYQSGGGGGFGERDISYAIEGTNLASILVTAKQAVADVERLAKQIEDNLAKLGFTGGLEMSAGGFIMDSDYEYNFSFDEAEEMVRQSQQLGKQ